MKAWLIIQMMRLLKHWGVTIFVMPQEVINIIPEVKAQVEITSAMPGLLSNEYRHANTYAALKKKLPDAQSKHIGLAIEVVLNGLF